LNSVVIKRLEKWLDKAFELRHPSEAAIAQAGLSSEGQQALKLMSDVAGRYPQPKCKAVERYFRLHANELLPHLIRVVDPDPAIAFAGAAVLVRDPGLNKMLTQPDPSAMPQPAIPLDSFDEDIQGGKASELLLFLEKNGLYGGADDCHQICAQLLQWRNDGKKAEWGDDFDDSYEFDEDGYVEPDDDAPQPLPEPPAVTQASLQLWHSVLQQTEDVFNHNAYAVALVHSMTSRAGITVANTERYEQKLKEALAELDQPADAEGT
jgi:hypothetical protein